MAEFEKNPASTILRSPLQLNCLFFQSRTTHPYACHYSFIRIFSTWFIFHILYKLVNTSTEVTTHMRRMKFSQLCIYAEFYEFPHFESDSICTNICLKYLMFHVYVKPT